MLRALVGALVDEPPDGNENRQTTSHQTGIVHRRGISRQSVREAEDNSEGDDVDTGQGVDDVANCVIHVEVSRHEGRTAGQDVRENGHEVRKTGQLHEASHEGAEGGSRAEVDARQDGDETGADQGGVEGVLERGADASNPSREWSGAITSNSPERTAGGDVTATGSDKGRQVSDDQKTQSAATGAGGLAVDLSQGEEGGRVAHLVEVVDGIEDCNHIADTSDETDTHLGQDSLGDISTRPGFKLAIIDGMGKKNTDLGISSAK